VIGRLVGTVAEKTAEGVVLDVGGVGYELLVPATSLARLPGKGGKATLVVHTAVREDDITLYGFSAPEERNAFRLLLKVSQIGPKVACSILSGLDAADLGAAIARGDTARLRAVPGVGKKTAERIVLELREKFGGADVAGVPQAKGAIAQVVSALVHMGYRPGEAERAAKALDGRETEPLETLLRDALRVLSE
jgi:Holliday junction DNA helicase RuvA